MFIDSHCHLDLLNLDNHGGSLDNALRVAREAGVKGFLCIGIGLDAAESLLELEQQYPDVWLSLGTHPLNENLDTDRDTLKRWCAHPQVKAVGETGLDYHYSPDSREAQLASFRTHLQVAEAVNKPVIVHTREAKEDTIALLREYSGTVGVLHCFTETWEMAEQALDLGYYISISGIVTFRNASRLRDVVKRVPLDRLLIETDSPYLAPIPHRGKPNQPAFLPEVAKCVAELVGVDIEKLGEQTSQNFHRLFATEQ